MMPRLLIALLTLSCLSPLFAQTRNNLGTVNVEGSSTINVRVTASTAELQALARKAFALHGLYRIDGGTASYGFKFTAVAPTQVRVDISRGAANEVQASQVFTGANARQALLRAADFAVEKTNGRGLRGFFMGRLAFVSKRSGRGEVMVSDLFLEETKQLTHDNAHVLTPRWSPDGAQVMFTSYFRTGAPDIYATDAATGRRRETIVSLRGTNNGARFSPDGRQIAMTLSGSGVTEIYVANAHGKQIAARTRSDTAKASPCWSPDGAQIVFAMEPGPQLYVMPAGGGTPRRLNVGHGYAAEPDWSTTKRNLIACTVKAGSSYQIAVYDLNTGAAKVVSKASFDGVEPAWLADGRHLVYTARDRTSTQLAVLDTESGKSVPLSAFGAAAEQASVWTP